jgi:hypothetical protein
LPDPKKDHGSQKMKTFKLDGIRYSSKEELIESLWPLYESRMSREEFEKYVTENMVEEEK